MNQTQASADEDFSSGFSSVDQKRSDPDSSCVSMKSDRSMNQPLNFKSGDVGPDLCSVGQKRSDPDFSCVSMKSDQSMDPPLTFKKCPDQRPVITEPVFKEMMFKQKENQPKYFNNTMNAGFRSNLRKKFECLYEGTSPQGKSTLLNEIYTELYITESESGEISYEHEVRQIEKQSRKTQTEDTPIKCKDIFKPLPEQDKPIRSVMTKGVAGIGKTVSVQKFILDWTEEKENQDVHLIFPLPFREINLMKNKTLSLLDLLHLFFPETKEMEIFSAEYKVMFIFDGLDECRVSLDFHSSVRLCDVSESASVDVMLTNLIKGNLLPSALIWITSRPAAADLIPSECVDRVTEVRGFTDPQKEEYFSKRISDESLANRIISHLKSSRSLYIMCHIPVFCWISAAVLERMLSEAESEREIPKTLTQMYTHFLIIQTNIKHQKDYEKKVKDEDVIFKLGKLAFEQLVKGNLIFYEEDLRECDIDVDEASVYSGLCTQIFREEFGLYQGKVYSFIHLSVQEHLAALFAHLSITNNNTNVFDKITGSTYAAKEGQSSLSYLHQRAVDEALQSKNGHLDLFLRFLLGLLLESNQNLLRHLQTGSVSYKKEETVVFIQMRIWCDPSPEKSINLFHCLNELGDHSLIEEIQNYLKSGKIREVNLSPSQWSALVFVLLTSEQNMDVFKLREFLGPQTAATKLQQMSRLSAESRSDQIGQNKFVGAEEVLQKLLPVVKESRSVELSRCNITSEGCAALRSALRSNPSHLKELNLSCNNLGDSGVKLISDVLEDLHCKLEILGLSRCNITAEGCAALRSALRSNPSHLKKLDLSYNNNLGDSGVKLISDVLEDLHCKLEILELSRCNITAEGCAALRSALRSNPSHLKKLNLSDNYNLGDSGVKLISDVLEDPHCKLKILGLSRCNITAEGCAALRSALRSNPSHLKKLDLSYNNNLGDSGVKLISDVLEDLHCKLEILELSRCNITAEGCAALRSALRSNPSHLKKLDLSYNNNLGDSGVKLISDVLEDLHCKLEILELSRCNITAEGCAALRSALRSNPSHLKKLDLSYNNNLGDSGVKLISDVLEDPHCKLKILGLSGCKITSEGCAALRSALRSNPSHLKKLNLSYNNLGDSGVKLISDVLEDLHCKLKILELSRCNITSEGCAALRSALRSNPSHLKKLNLSDNYNLGDSGVKLISDVLEDPHCKLEILGLSGCKITSEGCAALRSALRSNPSHLKKLNLSDNNLGDSGVKLISDVLEDLHCKLEILGLWNCNITDEGTGSV